MTALQARKTRLTFETCSIVRECGRVRQVVIEAEPHFALVRLKGTRTRFTVPWGSIYELGAKLAAQQLRREKTLQRQGGDS